VSKKQLHHPRIHKTLLVWKRLLVLLLLLVVVALLLLAG
jgi:hypothetical protein